MPKNPDIKKVMVIGSGPIIIGQAAEFDYAGTQACRALKEEGMEVVLVNSNPATIMTDKNIADRVYIEPLNVEFLKKIIIKEKPDSILPTLGGQTGLNLATELSEIGFLDEHGVKLLGTKVETIKMAEDRQEFKNKMEEIGEPCIASKVVDNYKNALDFANEIGFPVIVRPAYTLGGTGGGIAYSEADLEEIAPNGLRLSRVHQVLIEKCISGWKEIEFEVMRDSKGNVITICSMENIDPVGVHTGDSIVVAPAQTLTDKEYQMLRSSALNIISSLGVEGGCNVQHALNPFSNEYAVIEVNPRVSRSSALASKATGYPIAKVATKIAVGYGLDEIMNAVTGKTYACFEPAIDYAVVKFPKWPFDKFVRAKRLLGTQMKATGEVMAIETTIEAAFMKAVRSIELGIFNLEFPRLTKLSKDELIKQLAIVDDERIFVIAEALRRGITPDEIFKITMIDKFFIGKIKNLVDMENSLKEGLDDEKYLKAKKMGFTDSVIERLSGEKIKNRLYASYKIVDTCAAEFEAATPYYYSTYDKASEHKTTTGKKKILVLGSGPIRIGQGIEFDYCSVHSVWALRDEGYETIIANCNPETVSTDFDTADRLYFDPLTPEDIENLVNAEKPDGAIVQFGGQTAIKLTKTLVRLGVPILGTSEKNIDAAEDREKFDKILERCGIPRPAGKTVFTREEALEAAQELGYPVLVRPSYVLGGQGMEIAFNDYDIIEFMEIINRVKQDHPILVDKYLLGKEIEVDAICDGEDFLIPGIMEHLERAGVHSGDSISVYPPQRLKPKFQDVIVDYTARLAKALNVVGLMNIQFVLYDDEVYVIEVNPRSSRTVPYISKVTNVPMVDIALKCVLGKKLKDLGYGTGLYKESEYKAIKVPVFSFEKLHDVDTSLGPEMKSTGEVLGISKDLGEALYKGLIASGLKIPTSNANVLITVRDTDKSEAVSVAKELYDLGCTIYATEMTAEKFRRNGVPAKTVAKIGMGTPDILDMIQTQQFDLIINTPTKGRQTERDGFKMRRKAVEHSIPCLTSLDTASAVIRCLKRMKTNTETSIVDITRI
ncbi:MAG: Carbamoyl-phosphate synthase large chain [Firmicutes bacterium ADurb.Bin193]|nr:MAG: Carbamoyl-phosphate synthase large chain [Firmicutes bacterium ADurb.Bin193]